ncbi:hypothetical protein RB594_008726 [Gaeumannomyces avenae]
MAFHQPTARQSLNRPPAAPSALHDDSPQVGGLPAHATPQHAASPTTGGGVAESQTWVLFSPAEGSATTTTSASYLGSVLQSDSAERTPGRSHVSEVGSGDTIARSNVNSVPLNLAVPSVLSGSALSIQEEDAELDVLDSHLPEFRQGLHGLQRQTRHDSSYIHAATASPPPIPVLPTHDGLGSFRLGTPAAGDGADDLQMQEHIYSFERFNPRRVKRRRESLDLARLEVEMAAATAAAGGSAEAERHRRIEAWRQEQSLLLLEAIRRETRRRRQHTAAPHLRRRDSGGMSDASAAVAAVPAADELLASLGNSAAASHAGDMPMAGTEWHEQDAGVPGDGAEAQGKEQEGYLSRFTRKVIRDLLGIDDNLLAVLLGEALAEEQVESRESQRQSRGDAQEDDDLSSTPKASVAGLSTLLRGSEESAGTTHPDDSSSSSWQLRMLDRIARELGLLVHRMSTHHPGAFAAYARLTEDPLPYAGLPVIPEAEVASATRDEVRSRRRAYSMGDNVNVEGYMDGTGSGMPSVMMPQFTPTVPPHMHHHGDGGAGGHAQPIAIPGRQQGRQEHVEGSGGHPTTFTQQEWEQQLDIGLVFRYLRSRFGSSSTPSSSSAAGLSTGVSPHALSSTSQDAAARAARVRLHHPLVGRSAPRRNNSGTATTTTGMTMSSASQATTGAAVGPAATAALHTRQRSPSCASQQSPRSRRSGVTRRSGSFSIASAASRHSSRHYWDIGGSVGTGSIIASTGPMGSWGEV